MSLHGAVHRKMAGQNCFHHTVLWRPPHSHRGTQTSHALHRYTAVKENLQKKDIEMHLKSRFKCLPSVFLEVVVFTLAWVPPSIIMLAIFLIIEMAAVLLWTINHTSHPWQLSVLFREFLVLRILYCKIIPHHQTLLLMDICATSNILILQT